MRVLVIGGTSFVGRHITETLVAAGDDVTLFNRGRTNADLFDVPAVHGDRNDPSALARLADAIDQQDAVIDVSAYYPRQVTGLLEALGDKAGHYVYISTLSVYGGGDPSNPAPAGATEEDPTTAADYDDEDLPELGPRYGALKAACEEVTRKLTGDAHAIVRPGIVIGPHDPTGRFTYWPVRLADGGRVLAPGTPDQGVQGVDARDLAAFTVKCARERIQGTFNAIPQPSRFEDFLSEVGRGVGFDGELVWVGEEQLLAAGVQPFADLPMWLPRNLAGLLQCSGAKAAAAGLTCRPYADSAADTLGWVQSDDSANTSVGMSREREAEVLSS